jgi:hypothetical protein
MLLVTACITPSAALPNLDEVEEALGYSLAPRYLPEGFEFDQYEVLGYAESGYYRSLAPYASVLYKRFQNYAYHHIFIQYPLSFPSSVSDDFMLELLELEWQRPDDAVSVVTVNGETAYLVRGTWSAESLRLLQKPDPELLAEYTPEWDYEMYLSLYFNYELSPDEVVSVMIRAMLYPSEWITAKEMVRIAESISLL